MTIGKDGDSLEGHRINFAKVARLLPVSPANGLERPRMKRRA